jgi:centractin
MSYDDVSVLQQPVVIDNGSGVIKCGFAGEETPKFVFPSFVGRPKHKKVMVGSLEGEFFVGRDADQNRGLLSLKYPISHGMIRDWGDMERVWAHVYGKQNLSVSSEEHPVLLTEAPLNPRANRERAAEAFFETFNAPALYISPQATLSLYASGRTTGVVLDSGAGVTHSVPVFQGYALPHAVTRSDVGGRDVDERLRLLLRKAGYVLHTSAELETVRACKEETCYIAFDPAKEEQIELEQRSAHQAYRLPDGREIKVGPERFRAPELLFAPETIGLEYRGVHRCLTDSVFRADLDLRRTLFRQIVLAGGSTLFPGFGDRLLNEVRRLAPKDVKIRISASPERQFAAWTGGSILASLASFKSMWLRREEYDERGHALHRDAL